MANAEQLKKLGALVRQARIERGWELDDLHQHSGVGKSYLSNIERGYVNPRRGPVTPSDDILLALSEALNLSVTKLHVALGRVPEMRYKIDPETARVAEAYQNADAEMKRIFESAADVVLGGKEK